MPGAADPRTVPSTKDDPAPRELTGELLPGLLYPANMAVSRTLALELGGFDERIEAAEDNDFCYRWLRAGLLPAEQVTPNAPWRIRLTDEIRSRFVPDVPDGYLPLNEAAKCLGVARQTVLHQVQCGNDTRSKSPKDAAKA